MRPIIEQGQNTLSSRELGEKLGIPGAQVRKDLAWVVKSRGSDETGQAGVGYNCAALCESVRRVIGTHRRWSTLLMGVGNIGRALLAYEGFAQDGFPIVAVVDADPRMVGKKVSGHVVSPLNAMQRLICRHDITIAILAVPRSAAQAAANQLCGAGIRGILNFAPMRIAVDEGISVTNIDVSVSLEQLSMDISRRDQSGRREQKRGSDRGAA